MVPTKDMVARRVINATDTTLLTARHLCPKSFATMRIALWYIWLVLLGRSPSKIRRVNNVQTVLPHNRQR
jgi:hypothetical protein